MPLYVGIISRKMYKYIVTMNVSIGNEVTERQRNWS